MKQQTPHADRGDTRTGTEAGDQKQAVPRTPNEHDTSADSQSAEQSGGRAQNQAAHSDAASNRQDTDKGPVMDQVYDKVREGEPKR